MRHIRSHGKKTDYWARVGLPSWLILALALTGGCASTGEQAGDTPGSSGARSSQVGILAARTPRQHQRMDIEPTVVAYDDYKDPLIRVNRVIFSFNDFSYRYALVPLGKGYGRVVPNPVRQGVGNFFYNIKTPIYFVNNGLQLKAKAAGTNLLRFGINTTIGLLGLFDPAQHWFDLEKAETSFENTLAQYGVGYGVYLVLPFLGPSDLRNGTSAVTEHFLNPIPRLTDNPDTFIIQSFDYFQEFAPEAENYNALREASDDPYIFFRNLYLQGVQRDAEFQSE